MRLILSEIMYFTANGPMEITYLCTDRSNGAREAIIEYFTKMKDYVDLSTAENETDWLLAFLWTEGYKITKLDKDDI